MVLTLSVFIPTLSTAACPLLRPGWVAFFHRLSSTAYWSRLYHNSYVHFRHLNRQLPHFARLPKAQHTQAYIRLSFFHLLIS